MIANSGGMRSTASIVDAGHPDGPPSSPDGIKDGNGVARATPFLAVTGPGQSTAQVEIVVPVKDEERDLAPSVTRLHEFLTGSFPFTAHVIIADNGSTDGTWSQARALAARFPEVRAVHLDLPGRGRALPK